MKILAIDTSTRYLSVAVNDDEENLATFRDKGELKHSSLLLPAIDSVLKESAVKLKDISAMALSVGPGSFTGLRIGVAAYKAINLSLGIPIVTVPTLDVIAYNFIHETDTALCPLIDARKEKVYACFYTVHSGSLKRLSDYLLTEAQSFIEKIKKPTLLFGDAVTLYDTYCKNNASVSVSTREWIPKAKVVAGLGSKKAKRKQFTNPDKLVPLYLHSKYCQVKG